MRDLNIIDVSSLNIYIKNLIEQDINLARIYIKGEISNLNKHYTGHYYFTLKEENSKVSCMMFSSYVKKLNFEINNGDEVLIFAKLSVYDKLGTYQLYVYNIEPYGIGKLLVKFEELKKKLYNEGIFDKKKKKINIFPKKIAIVTSKSGAAVQDLIHTISNRYPCEINIYPCLVQGEDAPKSIIKSLLLADKSDNDTIILARGGGSKDDLLTFNDEELIRTCYLLNKPLITAIGHQIDFSLVDLVSDLSCITPTEAGEKSCANKKELLNEINSINEYANTKINRIISLQINKLLQLEQIIERCSPINKLRGHQIKIDQICDKLDYYLKYKIIKLQNQLNLLDEKIRAYDPRLRLKDGKVIVFQDQRKIQSIKNIKESDILNIYFIDGKANVEVKEIKKYGK